MERKSMSRNSTSSLSSSLPACSSIVSLRWLSGSTSRPLKNSVYACATRWGVVARPGRSGSSPIAARISATAASTRPVSMGATGTSGCCDAGGLARARGALRLRRGVRLDAAIHDPGVDRSLRRHLHGWEVREWTLLARKPLRALGELLDILEDLGELLVV